MRIRSKRTGVQPPNFRVANCGVLWTPRWQQRRRETGTVAATPRPGRRRYIGLQAEAVLREQVRAHPDATLVEHRADRAIARGRLVGAATMSRALWRIGRPLKRLAWS